MPENGPQPVRIEGAMLQLASRRWATAGLAVTLGLSITSCSAAAHSAPTVADDIFKAGRAVVDDATRAAERAAQNRAARDELIANVRAHLASDEWKAAKAAAKIVIKVSREDPACESTIDAVFDSPTDVAARFANLAERARTAEGGEGLEIDATAISDEASAASSDLELARIATHVEFFKDAYCE